MSYEVAQGGLVAWHECEGCGFRWITDGDGTCPRCERPIAG